MVADVLADTPAARAGLLPGDSLLRASDSKGVWQDVDPKSFSAFINASHGESVTLSIKRDGKEQSISASPQAGVATADPERYALGVEVATVGVVPLSLGTAIIEGAQLTWGALILTAEGLWHFLYGVFTFSADLSQVAGPVGIAGAVGSASLQGFGNLLSIMALISINLALINLIPVPALDGGRLLFVLIESVIRRPIKASIAYAVNAVGFVFLILLMLVVTAHDIFKIVG
jgi:regulator of sigma E protease